MNLPINQKRNLWWSLSALVIGLGIVAMAISWQQFGAPLRPGLDFVGGTRLQLTHACTLTESCTEEISLDEVRQVLADQGLESSSLQLLGQDRQTLSIRTKNLNVDERSTLQANLEETVGPFDINSTQIDSVGPVIGRQLLASGLLALLVSFAGIVAYLSLRFKLDYAVFAIVALAHDVLVTMGVFAVLGLVLGVEIDSLFIVALLTIVGFSVNDTVVIYDRIRENLKLHPERHISEVVDESVNQTLARSVNTTLTTTLPLLAIVLFGGQTLKFFALAMIVGFLAGVYSSIFVASTLLTLWRERSGQAYGGGESDSPDDTATDPDASTPAEQV
ncbi:protein translocase subunit SecF [Phormidium sp. FACHB-1136]|uniref:protein translocase subunit SecF n=1 Tax=Phormidium sp. FACHB-1136 TaxID=2692848 RepID=UPI00168991CE|nr:protein translocase subunit SecF [Phormidium sp. FACHB-1136]MBD2426861.1 protein translocase subunit SecF [Phormidium sp. FACHB-1136]